MASHEPQPVVMALSNPTSKCECTPEDVARATDGRGPDRDRQPVRRRRLERPHAGDLAVQQPLRLPGRGPRRAGGQGAEGDARHVPGGQPRAQRAGDAGAGGPRATCCRRWRTSAPSRGRWRRPWPSRRGTRASAGCSTTTKYEELIARAQWEPDVHAVPAREGDEPERWQAAPASPTIGASAAGGVTRRRRRPCSRNSRNS